MKSSRAGYPLYLLAFAAACSGGESTSPDVVDCSGSPPSVVIEGPSALEPEATTVELTVRFDVDVVGVALDETIVAAGATLAALSGAGPTYTVTAAGLEVGRPFTVEVLANDSGTQIHRADCEADVLVDGARFDSEGPVERWRHQGPITRGPPSPRADPPYFVEQTSTVGIDALGLDAGRAMIVDFDGDGREDIVTLPVASVPLAPRFVRNVSDVGRVRFEDATESSGMQSAAMALLVFGDVDNDGDADAFAGLSFRAADGQGGVWLNDGTGRFTHQGLAGTDGPSVGRGFFNEAAAGAFADFDGDGLLDLYVGHWYAGSSQGSIAPTDDVLYKGLGGGQFSKATLPPQTNPLSIESDPGLAGVGRAAYGIAVGDYDDDGDLDIFVNNYGAGRPALDSPPRYWDHNLLWRNDGNLTFVDVSTTVSVGATTRGIGGVQEEPVLIFEGRRWPAPIGGNGFGCQFADFDNDGDLDLIIGTIAHPDYTQSDRTMLHVNQGPPGYAFTEESFERGLEYYEDELHPVMVDVDNDGRLDLAMSRLRGGSKWRLYFQQDDAVFALQEVEPTGVDISRPGPTLWFDADDDGDLDFFMPQGGGRWFENRVGAGRNFLKVSLVGDQPRDATGAKVSLETSAGRQQRFLSSGEGHYNTQQSRVLHFGLGADSGAADVRIRWPNGETTELGDVRANQHLRVVQSGDVEIVSE